jgi:hypothetical protein
MEEHHRFGPAVESFLSLLKPIIREVASYRWEVGSIADHFWEFARRAVLVRQYEALHALVIMSREGQCHFGVTFLRAAFEELVWVEYLTANSKFANELIKLIYRWNYTTTLRLKTTIWGRS